MSAELASFFTGIGGFDLGFQEAGFQVGFQCEINQFCREVLEAHWPKVARAEDIRDVQAASVPEADVWVGGFPCQDLSLARMGPRAGLKGAQSGLFFEFTRLIGARRPRVVILENVPGLLSSHRGKDFEAVLTTLANLGYSVGWRVLNSKYFGVAQSRQRVYVAACHRDRRGPGQILFESERGKRNSAAGGSNGEKVVSPFKVSVGDTRKGPITPALAYCLYATSARHTGTDWSRNYVSYPQGRVRRLMPLEAERLQGFPEGWTRLKQLELLSVDDSDSLRYQALGNAVSVPVARWVAGRVKDYLACTAGARAKIA